MDDGESQASPSKTVPEGAPLITINEEVEDAEGGEWQITTHSKKRKMPARQEEEEIWVELEGPPTKKIATAQAVATSINMSFRKLPEGEEIKAPDPMPVEPQAPSKRPKIQTAALPDPKGKGKPKEGEDGGRTEILLKKSLYDLELPEEILQLRPYQADGVYAALAERMSKDGDWVDVLWGI